MPDRRPSLEPGTVIANRFRIDGRLGAGGYGTVYRATQLSVDRPVALKILHADLAHRAEVTARFEREARLASRVRHPNAVTMLDFGADGDRLYLAMEYVDGPSLRRVLKDDGPMPWQQVVALADRICAALGAAHALGLVHRDLKPANILMSTIDGQRQPVVIDFGLAKVFEGDDHETLTRTDVMIGTPAYMSPESVVGEPLDARSDLYSLGIVLYQALSGAVPFKGRTPIETATQQIGEPPPPLVERVPTPAPAALIALVERLLAKDPTERPASAAELRARLAGIDGDDDATIAVAIEPGRPSADDADERAATPPAIENDDRPPTMMAPRPPEPKLSSRDTTEPVAEPAARGVHTPTLPPSHVAAPTDADRSRPARRPDRGVIALVAIAATLAIGIIAVLATPRDRTEHETSDGTTSAAEEPPAASTANASAPDPAPRGASTVDPDTLNVDDVDAAPTLAEGSSALAVAPPAAAPPPGAASTLQAEATDPPARVPAGATPPIEARIAPADVPDDEPDAPEPDRAPAQRSQRTEAPVTIMVDGAGTILLDEVAVGEGRWSGEISAQMHVARVECVNGETDQVTFEAVAGRETRVVLRCPVTVD